MDGMEKTRSKLKGESMTMSVKTSVDWRGRPCKANKHGGMTAAIFVLGLSLSLSLILISLPLCYILVYLCSLFFIYISNPRVCHKELVQHASNGRPAMVIEGLPLDLL